MGAVTALPSTNGAGNAADAAGYDTDAAQPVKEPSGYLLADAIQWLNKSARVTKTDIMPGIGKYAAAGLLPQTGAIDPVGWGRHAARLTGRVDSI
jgi:hypothetical protein